MFCFPSSNLSRKAVMPLDTFRALRTHQTGSGAKSFVETLRLSDLTEGELVVRTRWAGVNYKDCLGVTGRAKVLRGSPRIAGIELVGVVEESASPDFRQGDAVLVHGFETGIVFDGGFSEIARIPAVHAMRVPEGLEPYEAAVLGVAGFTVAMALDRFQALGLTPEAGPVAVSGATGAVGTLAVAILSRLGYRVVALTRRSEFAQALSTLGAAEVVPAGGTGGEGRPLEAARFAAAIDNVGGEVLSWLLRSLQPKGLLASVGNASGIQFTTNVLPFILREVQMFGIVANAPWPVRRALWGRLAGEWKPDFEGLRGQVRMVGLDELHEHCLLQVDGNAFGRTLLAFE